LRTVPMTGLPSGVYLLQVRDSGGLLMNKKIFKQ
jgi:hypothetical protein